jgi:hypothetical protein
MFVLYLTIGATKFSGNIYINTRISQRLVRNTLVVTPMDQSAPDQPRIQKSVRHIIYHYDLYFIFLLIQSTYYLKNTQEIWVENGSV